MKLQRLARHNATISSLQLRLHLPFLLFLLLRKLLLRLLLEHPPQNLPTHTLRHRIHELHASSQFLVIRDFGVHPLDDFGPVGGFRGGEAALAHDVGAGDFCAEEGGVDADDGDVVD